MPPEIERLLRIGIFHACWIALAVPIIKLRDRFSEQARRFHAHVAIAVHHQLVEIGRRLTLLLVVGVRCVAVKQPEIHLQTAAVRFAARLLQKIPELSAGAHAMHDSDVRLHAHVNQRLHRVVDIAQRNRRHLVAHDRHAVQRLRVDAEIDRVVEKILEPRIDKLVAAVFFGVDVFQLGQDDVKRFLERRNARAIFAVHALLLDAEICVDKHQRLYAEALRLQIPRRMVGSDVANVGDIVAVEPAVRVIIMHVRHRFAWLAAKFSEIMPSRRAAHQRQIDRHADRIQRPCHEHRHIMHAGDVLQRFERRRFHVQAKKLIDIILPPRFEKERIFVARFKVLVFLRRQQLKIDEALRRDHLALLIEQKLQHRQIKMRRRMVRLKARLLLRFRIEHRAAKVIDKREPALLRRLRDLRHRLRTDFQHLSAGDPLADRKNLRKHRLPKITPGDLAHALRREPCSIQKRLARKDRHQLSCQQSYLFRFHDHHAPAKIIHNFP